jgi:serine phosphatase RsbU (regulator of sigma subunit)
MFGDDRLISVLDALPPQATADDVTHAIIRAVQDFAGDAPRSDDITVLALRRT